MVLSSRIFCVIISYLTVSPLLTNSTAANVVWVEFIGINDVFVLNLIFSNS